MASISYTTTRCSTSSHETAGFTCADFGEIVGSASSHGSTGLDDYKILEPGDFRRVKSQKSMRSRPASRIVYALDSESATLIAPESAGTGLSRDATSLPPDFDLVIQNRPRNLAGREARDRATFGPWNDDAEDETARVAPADLKEELVSIADEGSDTESTVAIEAVEQPIISALTPSPASEDMHLSQLKQEAEEAWANYRPGMTPQQRTLALESELDTESITSDQPVHIPRRITSLRRSSQTVLTALPKPDLAKRRGSVATLCIQPHSSSDHVKGTLLSRRVRSEFETFPRITTPFQHGSASSSRDHVTSDFHVQRPYTASILSSASEGSFLGHQNSFESGMSPLLLNCCATTARLPGRLQRPATAGSIPALGSSAVYHSCALSTAPLNRPETSNQLSAEQRRQQVRRTKKLTQMLGEEMLLATNTTGNRSNLAQQPQSLGSSTDLRRKKYRPQSMPFSNGAANATGGKTRALSRKLLQSRGHSVKSWNQSFSELGQPPLSAPAGLNRKAAAILGLPHPYSSSALIRASDEGMVQDAEELDEVEEINPFTRPFIPSGLEEFNEYTPKVDQLAAFSAAALDEGASPTLPQDGPFRPFDRSHLDQALAMSEGRKLAVARDERRRRVAKMSRWLGEAVPAELIMSAVHKKPNAVIGSTDCVASSHSSASHHTTGYGQSEADRSRRIPISTSNASSNGHGSISHEGSVVSNLQSFMSIDSSDESDTEAAAVHREGQIGRGLAERRSVAPSPPSNTSALADSLTAYRTSIDSYEYLLENDHERLSELASIFHNTHITPNLGTLHTMVPITRPPVSSARPRTSPSADFASEYRRLINAGNSPANRPATLSATVDCVPRRSAAFLELSDSDSDSSDADELYECDDPSYSFTFLRRKRLDSHDRSITKLSNFFGSTPSQIVRSQRDSRPVISSADSVLTIGNASISNKGLRGKASQPHALKTILRSLEEEALDDSKLTSFQKSEISRKVHLLKKRTTKMFA
ncbi:uncharacterized protein MEPE_00408 [Melanopsichium pennsylvanicum]|uniref:Uncharacterized protein n=2 Tax=Melanopsichium pennsylvanicum TaxID=63383 RepID=A0AAJ5C2M7_9BASI|nr:putative protein [Melanopsichium pennsylvanicum 4]SNX81703.1 uncharacterized protein MEPE_00408 [Melanopsichium pennsylvanicum]